MCPFKCPFSSRIFQLAMLDDTGHLLSYLDHNQKANKDRFLSIYK